MLPAVALGTLPHLTPITKPRVQRGLHTCQNAEQDSSSLPFLPRPGEYTCFKPQLMDTMRARSLLRAGYPAMCNSNTRKKDTLIRLHRLPNHTLDDEHARFPLALQKWRQFTRTSPVRNGPTADLRASCHTLRDSGAAIPSTARTSSGHLVLSDLLYRGRTSVISIEPEAPSSCTREFINV